MTDFARLLLSLIAALRSWQAAGGGRACECLKDCATLQVGADGQFEVGKCRSGRHGYGGASVSCRSSEDYRSALPRCRISRRDDGEHDSPNFFPHVRGRVREEKRCRIWQRCRRTKVLASLSAGICLAPLPRWPLALVSFVPPIGPRGDVTEGQPWFCGHRNVDEVDQHSLCEWHVAGRTHLSVAEAGDTLKHMGGPLRVCRRCRCCCCCRR